MTHDGGEQTALRRSAAVARVSHVIERIGLDRTPARRPQRVHAGGFVEDLRDMASALEHGDADRLVLDRHGSAAAVHVTHGASIMTRRECRSAEQHPRASRRGYAQKAVLDSAPGLSLCETPCLDLAVPRLYRPRT